MTKTFESAPTTTNADEVAQSLEFESPEEQARIRIVTEAILARTIKLDTRRDNSFQQSKTPEYFID